MINICNINNNQYLQCNKDLSAQKQINLKYKSNKIDNMPSSAFPKTQIPMITQLLTRMKMLTQQFVEKEQNSMNETIKDLGQISPAALSEMEIKIMPVTHVLKIIEFERSSSYSEEIFHSSLLRKWLSCLKYCSEWSNVVNS